MNIFVFIYKNLIIWNYNKIAKNKTTILLF